MIWEFPGSPVVRTRCFHCHGLGSIPGRGTKIPQAAQHNQKKKKKKKDSFFGNKTVLFKKLPEKDSQVKQDILNFLTKTVTNLKSNFIIRNSNYLCALKPFP